MSMHHVPSHRQCDAIRWSSPTSTRKYCARLGTSNLPIRSAAITYASSLDIAAT